MKLHWQIALALIAAIAAGTLIGAEPWFIETTTFLGTLFLNALRMLIVPLIFAAMIHAILGIESPGELGRIGWKTALYFAATTLGSILIGLVVINLVQPGVIDGTPAGDRLGLSADTSMVLEKVQNRGGGDLIDVILRMVPPNLLKAAVENEMLGLIFFSLLFGYFASRMATDLLRTQRSFWAGVYEVMINITNWVMLFAPIGVFALVARTVAQTGWAALEPLLLFFVCVLSALMVQAFLVLPLLVRLFGLSPWRHLQLMTPALLTAFSTSSSAATLPVTFGCVKKAGVTDRVSGFVLPLGATVNMNGTALYECAAALFIAQAYGLHLSLFNQFVVVVLALLTSVGVAGIPSASLVAISVILTSVGLPLEGVGMILAVDRILDMCRTAVNVFGDATGAVIIAHLEHEESDDGVGGAPLQTL
ncbi:dicarboxylate/amino acid:cation symporter [Sinimarinibacterium sp. CAU 1509]|uniref:dicarboxylate/amino acid:cation symporter n=1 Tax=Sinimarinibacterium sp. CAU 1509 TaxID=2562283 RepID=UPI0010AD407F|nr:dicarboxylate/amino acid:cation symporter [Sinimarinibacterium sp. CAU 1509]TJY60988.1 dicarboxylate/amino acid:cation symporter [Sinimarinibacterium sp. CAU 1509]